MAGQDALHEVNRNVRTAMTDALTKAGVPSVLVGAATLPSHVFDSVVAKARLRFRFPA